MSPTFLYHALLVSVDQMKREILWCSSLQAVVPRLVRASAERAEQVARVELVTSVEPTEQVTTTVEPVEQETTTAELMKLKATTVELAVQETNTVERENTKAGQMELMTTTVELVELETTMMREVCAANTHKTAVAITESTEDNGKTSSTPRLESLGYQPLAQTSVEDSPHQSAPRWIQLLEMLSLKVAEITPGRSITKSESAENSEMKAPHKVC
ncbi:unnamed protein product [Leuciscus chuanchicus]